MEGDWSCSGQNKLLHRQQPLYLSGGMLWWIHTIPGRREQTLPVQGFIGPMDEIYPSEIIASFVPFFEELLNTDDFHSAIESLNRANAGRLSFQHMNAEAFFDAIVELYRKELRLNLKDGKVLERMVDSLWASPDIRMRFTKPKLKRFIQNRRNGLLELLNGLRPRFLHLG